MSCSIATSTGASRSEAEIPDFVSGELVDETGWYDFHARMYFPALGRFLAVDPAGQFASPYVGMGNNPVVMVDPDGEFVIIAAALLGGALNVWSNANKIKSVGSFFAYFGSGAIGGAVSVANPALGGSLTTGLNVGIDVVTGNLPDFDNAADVATYVGFKALEGFGTAGVGKMTKAGLDALKPLGNSSGWLRSFSSSGKTVGSIAQGGAVLPEANIILTKVPAKQLAANSARIVAKTVGNFTKSNFRSNLINATGINPGRVSQAHHVFPQAFEGRFAAKGLNIHDPKFGAWWETSSHLKNAKGYNAAWESFFRTNPSQSQILNNGRQLMQQYGIPVVF